MCKKFICSECEESFSTENISEINPSICKDCDGENLLAEDD